MFEFRVSDVQCLSAQGTTSVIHNFIHEHARNAKTILIDRGRESFYSNYAFTNIEICFFFLFLVETLMHHRFGDEEYWSIRRATRYAKHLVNV